MNFEFGSLRILSDRRQALLAGQPVPIGARAFDVLVALAERRGRLVLRDELLGAIWAGRVVEDNNLTVQIAQLRRVLGPKIIVTVPGRGYWFVPPPAEPGPADVASNATTASKVAAPPVAALAHAPLVGREQELSQLASAIGTSRLVTVQGMGGVGKSALARQVVHERDSAWVDIEALASGDSVPLAVARALGVGVGGTDAVAGLVHALRPLCTLIVLDGAEHRLEDVATLARTLLRQAPGIRLLVTSQIPLRHADESVFKLEPLPVPPADSDAARAGDFAAVQLLVRRARAYSGGFVLDSANVSPTIQICELLDGLPLALELAAVRLASFGPEALLADLRRSLRALGQGRRDAPARQRSLLATLEASHARLPEPARRLFRRLAVFRGGFDMEMAAEVGAAGPPQGPTDPSRGGVPGLDRWRAVDALTELVDRSLVSCDEGPSPRYSLLATTAALAREKLRASSEEDDARRRHAQMMRWRYEALEQQLLDGEPVDDVFGRFRQDVSNALEAFEWASRHDHECALALVPGLQHAFEGVGAALGDVLARAAELIGPHTPARLRMYWSRNAMRLGYVDRTNDCTERLQQGIDLARETGDRVEEYLGTIELCAVGALPPDEKLRLLDEAARLEDPDWAPYLRLRRQALAGMVLTRRGRLEDAFDSVRQAIQLAELARHTHAVFQNRNLLVDLLMMTGRRAEAIELARAAAAPLRKALQAHTLAMNQINLCGALLLEHRIEEAMPFILEGWLLGRAFHYQAPWSDYLALLAALRGRAADAVRLAAHANAGYAHFKGARQPNEAEAVRQAEAIATADASVHVALAGLREQGAGMTDEAVAAVLAGLLGLAPADVVRRLDREETPDTSREPRRR